MERLKQLMGFLVLGVVIWLLGVYAGTSEEVARLTALGGFLLVVAVACWIHGIYGRRLASWSTIAILLGTGSFLFLADLFRPRIAWEPWSEKRVVEATSQGQPVFVDFTASWCLNCRTNENLVIETEAVREALARKNVLPLKADFSRKDPAILAELQKYGRGGVPAYLICPPGKPQCDVLPELLSKNDLLARIDQLP
jgi:thiol:disulfide interchange protein DsbD